MRIRETWTSERAATAAEYAVMASLIAAVVIVAVGALGTGTIALFQRVLDAWP